MLVIHWRKRESCMIKKLRKKFVFLTMTLLIVVFGFIFLGLNTYNSYWDKDLNYELLEWIAVKGELSAFQSDEAFWGEDESEFVYLIYTVKLDKNNRILTISSSIRSTVENKDMLTELVNQVVEKKKTKGEIKNYLFYQENKDYGSFVVFMDTRCNKSMDDYIEYISKGFLILLVGGVLFLVSVFLSRFVTGPAEETVNKQKQFISDASHELKTPLSAILVNADVLSAEIGENQSIANIKSEAVRMDGLVRKLLELARADDVTRTINKRIFDLSEAMYQMLLPFESRAFEENIEYHYEIKSQVLYHGDCADIKQVIAILLDNAFKYTHEQGEIMVTLKTKGERKIFSVYNTGNGILEKDLPHIFERFYCCDQSRAMLKKSYGLGLAIAQSIVQTHGGTIKAESEVGKWTRLTAIL